jgi:hypothetical protein
VAVFYFLLQLVPQGENIFNGFPFPGYFLRVPGVCPEIRSSDLFIQLLDARFFLSYFKDNPAAFPFSALRN